MTDAPRRCFHHLEFPDPQALAGRKNGLRIAVCIPTLNEAATIASIVHTIRRELMEDCGLVDELRVVDSGSSDATCELAAAAGARVHRSQDLGSDHGSLPGKGENLWKSQFASTADIFCFIDGDLTSFDAAYIRGLLGPLLLDPAIHYVKAFYQRPLSHPSGHAPDGGGRVSEILVRPMISLFYPELAFLRQPLAGEYAIRRNLLANLPFPTGYGVEIAHLIDLLASDQLASLAQVDLETRSHRNRSEDELGLMSFTILRTIVTRLQRDGRITLDSPLATGYLQRPDATPESQPARITLADAERPAFSSIAETESCR